MRVIVVSSPLRATEAEKFVKAFRDRFKGYYVATGDYYDNGQGLKYPRYWVVRLPKEGEEIIDGHEMEIGGGELLGVIGSYKLTESKAS